MNWPTDTLAGIYLFLFAFGLIFSLATFFLGSIAGHIHLPGGIHIGPHGHADHLGHAGHIGHHGSAGGDHAGGGHDAHGGHDAIHATGAAPSPLNLSTLMIFLTWFGATGYILRVYYGAVAGWTLLAGLVLGTIGASVVYLFLAKVLWRGQSALDPANYQIEGTVATVTSAIRAGGTGEIVYKLDGKRRVDGARSTDSAALPAGADVVILRYQGGLAYVAPLDWARDEGFPLDELGEAAPTTARQ